MNDLWNILTKELAIYGIKVINSSDCEIYYEGKFLKIPIRKVIGSLKKRIKSNGSILEETWSELVAKLQREQPMGTKDALDRITINLFVNTLKGLFDFSKFLTNNFVFNNAELQKCLNQNMEKALNKDYTQYPKDFIIEIPDYKIALDWIFRKISLLSYIISMLDVVSLGPKRVGRMNIKISNNTKNIKIARGISGPWANLDLPELERKFPYSDIAEEMEGRRRDIRKQRRYRQGHENYHGPNVGEGYYWRELRNEPFLWSDRGTESPYPSTKITHA